MPEQTQEKSEHLMIDRIGKEEYVLICDMCEETQAGPFESFYDAVQHKKDNGWKSRKINGSWNDVCPKCTKEAQRERENNTGHR